MRTFKIYSLLAIYFFSCVCLVIDFHYCGGELESIALYHADEAGCCGKDEGKIPGCCNDKLIVVDTDDNEEGKKYTVKNMDLVKSVSVYPPVENTIVDNHLVLEQMVIPINHAPPNSLASQLFIKNRVLLI
jgi:hypothetical protein